MSDNYVIAYTPNSKLLIGLDAGFKCTTTAGNKFQHIEFTNSTSLTDLVDYLTFKLPKSLGLAFKERTPIVLDDLSTLLKLKNVADASFYLDRMYQGWGASRHGHSWVDRTISWTDSTKYLVLDPTESLWCLYSKKEYIKLISSLSGIVREDTAKSAIPIFSNLIEKTAVSASYSEWVLKNKFIDVEKRQNTGHTVTNNAVYIAHYGSESSKLQINTKTQEKEMSLFDKLKDANVEAAKLAGTLTVGKAANDLLANALVAKLPWYSRLFSGTALRESSLTKLATANLTMVLAAHFGKGNEKLDFVANAMLQDAMVELVRDSDQLKGLLDQLANLAGSAGDITK